MCITKTGASFSEEKLKSLYIRMDPTGNFHDLDKPIVCGRPAEGLRFFCFSKCQTNVL
jgi:hypothetical protein